MSLALPPMLPISAGSTARTLCPTLKISCGNEPELKQEIIAPVRCILVLGLKHLPKVYASTLQVQ